MTFQCDNPEDNKLLNDPCISIQDGVADKWWLSPDIRLINQDGASDLAISNKPNLVDVRIHQKVDCALGDALNISVELWVCDPFLGPIGPDKNCARVFKDKSVDIVTLPPDFPGGSGKWLSSLKYLPKETIPPIPSPEPDAPGIQWIPNPTDPIQQPGHKCLIARCYPDSLKAPDEQFCVLADLHVAQHNIGIIPAPPGKLVKFQVKAYGLDPGAPETVTFKVVNDLNPNAQVREFLEPRLSMVKGYRRIVDYVPEKFSLKVPEHLLKEFRDNTQLGSHVYPWEDYMKLPFGVIWNYVFNGITKDFFGRFRDAIFYPSLLLQRQVLSRTEAALHPVSAASVPSYEADVNLPAGESIDVTFQADLSSSIPGDAHIFDILRVDRENRIVGGITVVAVVVEPT